MQKINRLLSSIKHEYMVDPEHKRQQELNNIMGKLSTDQLKELVYDEPTEERIKEIFASVGGLHILESW